MSRKPSLSGTKTCETCGGPFAARPGSTVREWQRARFCSKECAGWRRTVAEVIAGKSRMHSAGYVWVFLPMHPTVRTTYVYEHRLVMERVLGRFLASHEYVHHRNEDKTDNRPENLELVSGSTHRVAHGSGVDDPAIANLIRTGKTSRQITALGVSGHRVVRVRRELAEGLHG